MITLNTIWSKDQGSVVGSKAISSSRPFAKANLQSTAYNEYFALVNPEVLWHVLYYDRIVT